MDVRVRIAPSPTGSIHIGLARTALYNALYARQQKGTFVLRIEDTDEKRNLVESEQEIFDGLRWLGLGWDEGPDKGGSYGPYRQSERKALYRGYLEDLVAKAKIYPCYCTQEELEQERMAQQHNGQPPVYSGRCRTATAEQIAAWEGAGRTFIYRFATNREVVAFDDVVRGRVEFRAEHIGDFSVARDFDHPLFNFAVAVDDALMRISHVIRGEEHLSNTPKNILVLRALNFPIPVYAHLPLLLGANRKKLSKRDGATSVREYREQGFLPAALLNFLALLGWHPKDEREKFTLDELVDVFRLEDVQKAGAIFDRQKLENINMQYIRAMTPEAVIAGAGETLAPFRRVVQPKTLMNAVCLAQNRLTTLRELPRTLAFLLHADAYPAKLLVPKKGTSADTKDALAQLRDFFHSMEDFPNDPAILKERTLAVLQNKQLTTTQALWPLRVAFTGRQYSPDVFAVAALIGKEEVVLRIEAALKKFADIAEK